MDEEEINAEKARKYFSDQIHISESKNFIVGDNAHLEIKTYLPPQELLWLPPPRQTLPKPFIGRQEDLSRIIQDLTTSESSSTERQKTWVLQGMGGIGKTYLARKVAIEVYDQFPGGVIWVELGPSVKTEESAQEALRQIAQYIFAKSTVPSQDNLSPEQVAAWLTKFAPGRLFVVFDDVWHRAPLLYLNRALPVGAARLVTTRSANIATLLERQEVQLGRFSLEDGVHLLENRIGIQGDPALLPDLEALVTLLGGHALALEIAAGRMKNPRRVHDVLSDLRKGIGLNSLHGLKFSEDDERDTNLELSFALSYDSLSTEQKCCFRALGAFAKDKPFTAEAAAALWGMEDVDAAKRLLQELTDLALLSEEPMEEELLAQQARRYFLMWDRKDVEGNEEILDELADMALSDPFSDMTRAQLNEKADAIWEAMGNPENADRLEEILLTRSSEKNILKYMCYRQHPLLYIYAYALLEKQGNFTEAYQAHADYYIKKIQELSSTFPANVSEMRILQPNIVTALQRAASYKDTTRGSSLLAGHKLGIQYREQRLHRMKRLPEIAQLRRASLLHRRGDIERKEGNLEQALTSYNDALAIFRSLGGRAGEADVLYSLGYLKIKQHAPDQARTYLTDAVSLYRLEEISQKEAKVLYTLGLLEQTLGNKDQARTYCKDALPLYRSGQDRLQEAAVLSTLGDIESDFDVDQARKYYTDALSLYRLAQKPSQEAQVLKCLGNLELQSGNLTQAYSHYTLALSLYQLERNALEEFDLHKVLGMFETQRGNLQSAQHHYQEALSLLQSEHRPLEYVNILQLLGVLAFQQGNLNQADTYLAEALRLYHSQQSSLNEADIKGYQNNRSVLHREFASLIHSALTDALFNLGWLEARQGSLEQARGHLETALSFCRETQNHFMEALLLFWMGYLEIKQYDLQTDANNLNQASSYLDAILSLQQAPSSSVALEADRLRLLGEIEVRRGNYDQAQAHFDSALSLYRMEQSSLGEGFVDKSTGFMFFAQKDWVRARSYYEQALSIFITHHDPFEQAESLLFLGRARFEMGAYDQGMQDVQQAVASYRLLKSETWARYAEECLADMSAKINKEKERKDDNGQKRD